MFVTKIPACAFFVVNKVSKKVVAGRKNGTPSRDKNPIDMTREYAEYSQSPLSRFAENTASRTHAMKNSADIIAEKVLAVMSELTDDLNAVVSNMSIIRVHMPRVVEAIM